MCPTCPTAVHRQEESGSGFSVSSSQVAQERKPDQLELQWLGTDNKNCLQSGSHQL